MEIWPILQVIFIGGSTRDIIFDRNKVFALRFMWILNFLLKNRVGYKDLKFANFSGEILSQILCGSLFIKFFFMAFLRANFSFFHSKRVELFPLSI